MDGLIEQFGNLPSSSSAYWAIINLYIPYSTRYNINRNVDYYSTNYGGTVNLGSLLSLGAISNSIDLRSFRTYHINASLDWSTFGY